MKIGLIDVDGHNFPNIPLMKISAWHKSQGHHVEWYDPMFSGHMDKVYMSKVFSFTPDYLYPIDADEIIQGGSGYCISLVDGKEVFDKSKDINLPPEIEHIYPDYSLYGITDTAYGFLSRGCPRGCDFCHVEAKEGRRAFKVADLNEFWNGQKNIVLCDPNILACKQWKELLQQLIDSKAWVDINQGLDIRLMTPEKAEMLKYIKLKNIHFAWDRFKDRNLIVPKFKMFKEITGIGYEKLGVYVLVNFDTHFEQDLYRVRVLRDLGYSPYVMLYNKNDFVECDKNGKPTKLKPFKILLKKYTMEQIHHFWLCWKLQRWVNNRQIFGKCQTFESYMLYMNYKWEGERSN
jgi:hypothetical protein